MEVTTERVQSILQTLPIGYYLKHNVEVELSNTANTSFINLNTEKIVISMNNLRNAYNSYVTDEQLEETTRAVLYHELSHAILTPKNLCMTKEINIFEDERIETLLSSFYLNVNFKENIKRIVKIDSLNDSNEIDLFFKIVRFRQGPAQFVEKVSDIIKRYKNISAVNTYRTAYYANEIRELFNQVKKYAQTLKEEIEEKFTETNKDDEQTSVEANKNDENDNENDNENDKNDGNDKNDKNDENDENDEEQSNETLPKNNFDDIKEQQEDFTEDELNELTNSVISNLNRAMDNNETKSYLKELLPIISQAKSQQSNTSSAINTYSGVFDPRSVINDNYRYFVQKNRTGHLKQFSKIRLNLFIDRSGSFVESQRTVNAFLNALIMLEKTIPDFEFNVVTIGNGEKLHDKLNRQIECDGGNCLTKKIFEIMKSISCSDCTMYNIVMFDGNAFSHDVSSDLRELSEQSNFKVFNSDRTYIISDSSNKYIISKYAPLAKTTITENYAVEFKQTILKILANLFR